MAEQPGTRPAGRMAALLEVYTRDLTSGEVQRLFTHDARDAWQFYARDIDPAALDALPWHRRLPSLAKRLLVAFSLRLSPARRLVYALSILLALVGLLQMFDGLEVLWIPAGVIQLPAVAPTWLPGTVPLLLAFLLVNILVLMEVADRLSLKNDLEIAREIQHAMLPHDTYRGSGIEVHGQTRPANTVGGDFYDIQPQDDGRVVVALGDVAGKGSPAALLMALLLAILRTLLDEGLGPAALMHRLNQQIWRHAPRSRFITLFLGIYDPGTGALTYVNAGHLPPVLRRAGGELERLTTGDVALGLGARGEYTASSVTLVPGDVLVLYSDGITEAEGPEGTPFDEEGLAGVVGTLADSTAPDLGAGILRAVAAHAQDTRFADDLTVVVLRRLPAVPTL